MTKATIVIPAHNESAVIGRTLEFLSRGLSAEDFDVVIVANGCSDATASRARAAFNSASIIETDQPGKCNALNLGYAVSDTTAPIICLDADLEVTSDSLKALIAPFEDERILATCGRMVVQSSKASQLVRVFYDGWKSNPYFSEGKFGGLFALSPEGAKRVFPLPLITADDEFIRRSFNDDERVFVKRCSFTAHAPRSLKSLVHVRKRSLRGAREVSRMGLPSPERGSLLRMLSTAIRKPRSCVAIAWFVLLSSYVRTLLVFEPISKKENWERDLTARTVE